MTQDAITKVEQDIAGLRELLSPIMSSRHLSVLKIGKEVRDLKNEVQYLRESLHDSVCHQETLKRRLSFYEQREEDDLIRQSMDYDQHKETQMRARRHKYVTYAPRNFSKNAFYSRNFNPNNKK